MARCCASSQTGAIAASQGRATLITDFSEYLFFA